MPCSGIVCDFNVVKSPPFKKKLADSPKKFLAISRYIGSPSAVNDAVNGIEADGLGSRSDQLRFSISFAGSSIVSNGNRLSQKASPFQLELSITDAVLAA